MNFKFSITGEHFVVKLALVRISLDVDDYTSLFEFLIRGEVGKDLLWVNKVLGKRFQTSGFSLPKNKISLKVNSHSLQGYICCGPHLSCGPLPHISVGHVAIDGNHDDWNGAGEEHDELVPLLVSLLVIVIISDKQWTLCRSKYRLNDGSPLALPVLLQLLLDPLTDFLLGRVPRAPTETQLRTQLLQFTHTGLTQGS